MRFATYALLAGLAACGGNGSGTGPDLGPQPDAPNAPVTMINWTIRMGGTVLSCANAGASEVHILAKPEDGLDITKSYPCVLAPVMLTLPPGRYAIEAALTGNVFVTAPAKAVTVPASAQVMFDFYLQ